MLSELIISGTERLLLMLGWEREVGGSSDRKLHYDQLTSHVRNMSVKKSKQEKQIPSAKMFSETRLRPVNVSAPSSQRTQSQAWTSASAFDVAPSGTV